MAEILLALVSLSLIAFCVFREYLSAKERADLLDRLMARDFSDYKIVSEPQPEAEEEEEEDENMVRLDVEAIEELFNEKAR